jgi:hypothetical protein
MIGPQLESLILSGDAVFKTASIGFGALEALTLAKGKSYIITQISIEPFLNIITQSEEFGSIDTFAADVKQDLSLLLERINFQLIMYNARGVNNRWSFRNDMKIETSYADPAGSILTFPSIILTQRKIDTYILVDDTVWFYFYYPDFDPGAFAAVEGPVAADFNNVNPFPPVPFGYGFESSISFVTDNSSLNQYLPLNAENVVGALPPPIGSTYVNTWTINNNNPNNPLLGPDPNPLGFNMLPKYMPSLPLLNISYYEINKRTTTSGIV